jgi:anti-sigma factor RsiW
MTIDCRSFENRLEEFLDGKLVAGERLAMSGHARTCARCHELVEMLGASVEAPADLADWVLDQTTGRPCESARLNLCEFVDGRLDSVDAELLRTHLGACEECAALSRVLTGLAADLPLLAEMEPDERFVGEVLARTLPRRTRVARWVAQIAAGWSGLVRRPRFALEAGYVLTVVFLVFFGIPSAPIAGMPQWSADVAALDLRSRINEPLSDIKAEVSSRAETAWRSTGGKVVEDTRATAKEVTSFSSGVIDDIKNQVGTIWSRFASESPNDDDRLEGDES